MPPQRLQPLKDNLKVIAQARINWATMASLTPGGFDALPLFPACQSVVACQASQVAQRCDEQSSSFYDLGKMPDWSKRLFEKFPLSH